ncbi:hypothetical protein FHW58_005356 [Duganella sp. 1224]|uniref:hypothetical protein n=1 Tax=Duganella sp. 1224 TaxID=2587052 RepID=UPI0015C8250C|nr:hypothetical protein [Duganella sp. 1224]NYE64121.1 hypothetical protein [Duganella sp. 1224]
MKSTMSLQVDTDTLLRLITQLQRRGGTQDLSPAINSAIELWLREQTRLAKGCDPANIRGYQWKSLFLPEGTELRSWSYGDHNYARVVGDDILHKGRPTTPNQFAQSFARTTRNAWTDLSIKRPEDQHFKKACLLRAEIKRQPPGVAGAAAALCDTSAAALLTALQTQLLARPAAAPEPPPRPRDTTPGQGWDLPERRKLRFRIEDVAFE